MNKPLITCYTPTYNRCQVLLKRAIPSVLNQTYDNFEYIIVSDGSTDTTREFVKSINDPRIHFFEIERNHPHHNYNSEREWYIGGSYAANSALDKFRGDWIARNDDDDKHKRSHSRSRDCDDSESSRYSDSSRYSSDSKSRHH